MWRSDKFMNFNGNILAKNAALAIERMQLKIRIKTLDDMIDSGVISEDDYDTWCSYYNREFIRRYDEITQSPEQIKKKGN